MDGFCKACLIKYVNPSELLHYTEKNRRLFVYSTGLQVKQTDPLPFQLCQPCFLKMKMACQFKKQCRTSDKRLSHFLSLKEAGEETDFCTYLQNNDGSVLFKFPLNGHSTPSFQKPKEDDNVSTNTSIRNFMADFLREDEVPDTEAHIIREMIEQEADVLDDSLDSQWLQDDISIASDFRFSPYSTPLSKHNYQPLFSNSPVNDDKQIEEEQNSCRRNIDVLAAKKLFLNSKSCSSSQTESPRSQQGETNQDTFIVAKKILLNPKLSSSESQAESVNKLEENINQDSYIAKKRILLRAKSNRKEIKTEKDMETYLATKNILNSKSDSNEHWTQNSTKSPRNIAVKTMYESLDENSLNQGVQIAHKGFYVETNENTIQIADIDDAGGKRDSIDKNLEKLLNNTNDEVISLSALLASPSSESVPHCKDIIATPSVHRGLSGANTPTIANILFGEKLDDDQSNKEKQLEHTNRYVMTDKGDEVDILDDFFNKETGKYIGENEQKQDEIFEDYKNPNLNLLMPGKCQYDLTDFSCKQCNVSYKSERGLKLHLVKAHNIKLMRIRKNEPRVEMPCDSCGKIFRLKSNLSRHIKTMHRNPKTAQVCTVCSLEFTSEARLKIHMNIHDGVKHKTKTDTKNKYNLVCNICGHLSTHPGNLKTHIARHNKSYRFKCDPCGRGFYRKSDLQVHMMIHMNEKPFCCSQCSERFRRKDQLQIHLKNHAGEYPYICEICDKRFATSAKLKYHKNNSKICQNMRNEAALKRNKEIEDSIEQLYAAEALVTLSNDKIKAKMTGNEVTPTDSEKATSKAAADDKSINLEDISMEDLLENKKDPIVQDDDKMSLSDMFTIPIIIKHDT